MQKKQLLFRGDELNFTTGQGKLSVRKSLRIIHVRVLIFSQIGGAQNREYMTTICVVDAFLTKS